VRAEGNRVVSYVVARTGSPRPNVGEGRGTWHRLNLVQEPPANSNFMNDGQTVDSAYPPHP
jgi:hypothetical protein